MDSDSDDSDGDSHGVAMAAQQQATVSVTATVDWGRTLKLRILPSGGGGSGSGSGGLSGDRIKLSATALEDIMRRQQQSQQQQQLIFSIAYPALGTMAYGSVREFTAEDPDSIEIGPGLAESLLGQSYENDPEQVRHVQVRLVALPKCEYLRISPLDAGYLEIPDIRALLESHLRQNYACVAEGETLTVSTVQKNSRLVENHKFLITQVKPSIACSCIDVDINLDIIPLDVAIAEEAVKRKFLGNTSSMDTDITEIPLSRLNADIMSGTTNSSVQYEEYKYFKIKYVQSMPKHAKIEISLQSGDADMFVSTVTEQPNMYDHEAFNVDIGNSTLYFNVEKDAADVPFIYLGVRGYASNTSKFSITISFSATPPPASAFIDYSAPQIVSEYASNSTEVPPDTTQCSNCFNFIPSRTIAMHEAFCKRNNAVCSQCRSLGLPSVMKHSEMAEHWHCTDCWKVGHLSEKSKHVQMIHETKLNCECGSILSLPEIHAHKSKVCPERLILCRFCHLRVRAGPPSKVAKDLLLGEGFSEHESQCGSRTIQCVKCKMHVQLKDMKIHAQMHEIQKQNQPPPPLCKNKACSQFESDKFKNPMKLCQSCFSPFWSPRHDPGNQKLATKIISTYHTQMTVGCGKSFCNNKYCCTSSNNEIISSPLDATEAAVQSVGLLKMSFLFSPSDPTYYFCVADAKFAKRRQVAENMTGMGFLVEWAVKALEVSNDDIGQATTWLISNAPKK